MGWDGKLVPKNLVIEMFFSAEQKAIDKLENVIAAAQVELDEMLENAEEYSVIGEVLKDNGNLDKPGLKKKQGFRTELPERHNINIGDIIDLIPSDENSVE